MSSSGIACTAISLDRRSLLEEEGTKVGGDRESRASRERERERGGERASRVGGWASRSSSLSFF